MQLIAPDVLAAGRGLSAGACGFLLLAGGCLWALGWRWHRFWIVFAITLGAGLAGLSSGQPGGGQVMVVGVLLAVTAGLLALELARILAFLTGGVAAWAGAQAVLPQAQELWAVFLSGGLLGVVLHQLWTMLTTSLVGVLITWHTGLLLADTYLKTDVVGLASKHAVALNGGVIAATLLGVLVQSRLTPKPTAEDAHDAKPTVKEKNPKRPKPVELHDEDVHKKAA